MVDMLMLAMPMVVMGLMAMDLVTVDIHQPAIQHRADGNPAGKIHSHMHTLNWKLYTVLKSAQIKWNGKN